MVVESLVLLRRAAKKPDLAGVEEPARKDETVPLVRGKRFGGQRSTCHLRVRVNQRFEPLSPVQFSVRPRPGHATGQWAVGRGAPECNWIPRAPYRVAYPAR